MKRTRYIFVTGGVCSSLGKGIAASCIGALLESYGYNITLAKIDPYINIDAGTMSPIEHGEVYVTEDGTETDLDLGNYSRFTSCKPTKKHSITTGQIYQAIIERERRGDYLGKCVQMIPHVTDEIKQRIRHIIEPDTDVAIIEVGGTVGDIESTIFLESIRQLITEVGKENVSLIQVTLIPTLPGDKEPKTKPTQHAVQKFKEMVGIQPDILLCRVGTAMTPSLKKKIALFTHVPEEAIIPVENCKKSLYELPITYHKEGLSQVILKNLNLPSKKPAISKWERLMQVISHPQHEINIGIIAKYTGVQSTYTSICESLNHAGFAHKTTININFIDSEQLVIQQLKPLDAILVPGGFGERGIGGKIIAAKYARENKLPFLGICLGLQTVVIEYARNMLHLKEANSTEFDPYTPAPVIDLLASQVNIKQKGGTMRLGTYASKIVPDTLLFKAYNQATLLYERHRHRYEVNNQYLTPLTQKGLIISCTTQTQKEQLVEAVEWPNHPFGISVQFHPEFSSTPFNPHPLFSAFIKAILARK